jgi:hypothetical protein
LSKDGLEPKGVGEKYFPRGGSIETARFQGAKRREIVSLWAHKIKNLHIVGFYFM